MRWLRRIGSGDFHYSIDEAEQFVTLSACVRGSMVESGLFLAIRATTGTTKRESNRSPLTVLIWSKLEVAGRFLPWEL